MCVCECHGTECVCRCVPVELEVAGCEGAGGLELDEWGGGPRACVVRVCLYIWGRLVVV